MIKKLFLFLFTLGLSFSLTSCFDIVEEIDLKSGGSGKIKLTVNLSKSKTKVGSLMKLDKIEGMKIPTEKEIRSQVNEVTNVLKNTKGISNVKSSLDFTNYIATLSCDFTDINALNSFTKTLSGKFKTEISQYSTYSYSPKTKTLSRNYTYNPEAKKALNKISPENRKSIQDAYFTSIYRFDNTVNNQNNKDAKIAASKKAVMLKSSLIDVMSGKVNLSNTIILN